MFTYAFNQTLPLCAKDALILYLLVYSSGIFDLISGERFVDASFWLSDLVRRTRSGYVRRIRIKIGIN